MLILLIKPINNPMNRFLWPTSFLLLIIPQISRGAGFLDNITCIRTGTCGLDDIATGFIFLTQLLLGAVGAMALVYFIWGAIQWVSSGGSAEKVKSGKEIMVNTIFALLITFGSYLIVTFFVNNILNVAPEYQIGAECKNKSQGTACNQFEINYICTGNGFTGEWAQYNEICVTKCGLKNIMIHIDYPDYNPLWAYICMDKPKDERATYEPNLCPKGPEYVCVLVDGNNNPIIQ